MTLHTIFLRSLGIVIGGLLLSRAADRAWVRAAYAVVGACMGCLIGTIADVVFFG